MGRDNLSTVGEWKKMRWELAGGISRILSHIGVVDDSPLTESSERSRQPNYPLWVAAFLLSFILVASPWPKPGWHIFALRGATSGKDWALRNRFLRKVFQTAIMWT